MPIDLNKNGNLQRLFLLEFLVDNVKFDYDKIDLSESTMELLQETCVRFRFLDFPVIEVCEEDFCQTQPIYEKVSKVIFKNGKSFFFSLSCLLPTTKCLKLGAVILRRKVELPPTIIGTSCIVLDKCFTDLLIGVTGYDEDSKTVNDIYPILDDRGIIIGSLTLLVRLSCFGKAVITHFKVPQEHDAGYMFANTKDQGRKPTQIQDITSISHGYPDPNNQARTPDQYDAFHPGMHIGEPEAIPINERGMFSRNIPSSTPDTYPGTPSGTLPSKVLGMYPDNVSPTGVNAWGVPGRTPESFPGTPPGTLPNNVLQIYPKNMPDLDVNTWGGPNVTYQPFSETFPGALSGNFPGFSQGTFPGTASGTFAGNTPGMFPESAPGTFPGSAAGTFPGSAAGTFPGTSQGAFSGKAPGTFPGTAPTMTGTFPEINEESTPADDLNKNKNLQHLFLLELLVDNIKFDYEKIDLPESILDTLMQTCVRFNFLDFPPIEVCEEDFCSSKGIYDRASKIIFKNGKSYFFPLNCLPPNIKCLNVGAIIVRHRDEPPPVIMGTSCITLDKGFLEILNPDTKTEASKSLNDVYPILDERGIVIGSLTLLVRLSCFGKTIITHFKVPQEEDAGYMFANAKDIGRKVDLTATQIGKTPPEYPDRSKHKSLSNIVYPEMYSGASPVIGSNPMAESSKTSPMIFRGFRKASPGDQSKPGTPART